MKNWKKLAIVIFTGIQLNAAEAQITQDSIASTSKNIVAEEPADFKIPKENKRQRNKTGATVLVCCLFIISTTILLYNVRSK